MLLARACRLERVIAASQGYHRFELPGGRPGRRMDRLQHHSACLRAAAGRRRPLGVPARALVAGTSVEDTRTPVCLVIGAGAGIGQAVARKFAKEGLHACVVRRGGGPSSLSDEKTPELFEQFVQSIKDDGGQATAFLACVAISTQTSSAC